MNRYERKETTHGYMANADSFRGGDISGPMRLFDPRGKTSSFFEGPRKTNRKSQKIAFTGREIFMTHEEAVACIHRSETWRTVMQSSSPHGFVIEGDWFVSAMSIIFWEDVNGLRDWSCRLASSKKTRTV
jgi:hypothetical protein